ncbi:hypothetical protein [Streptomyces sp. NBC_01451]|uniref:hypothetical protein n=1 Tax=Streptomyces sp. NBC_01451 TaxID=2903872 RepID=UPI002E34C458|nr:hypothetical protein [Streptomyces sp. NBC_01451]
MTSHSPTDQPAGLAFGADCGPDRTAPGPSTAAVTRTASPCPRTATRPAGSPGCSPPAPRGARRRPGADPGPLRRLDGSAARVEVLYPAGKQAGLSRNPDTADLAPALPTPPSAVPIRLTHAVPEAS